MNANSASASSTSAAAPRIWRCSRRARFAIRRSYRSLVTRSPTTSRYRCARPRNTPKTSRCVTPARCRSWRTRTKASKFLRWVTAPRAAWRARRWPKWSSRVRELFGLAREELRRSGFEEIIASGIVLTAAAPRWKARSNLPRRCFTCRCASAAAAHQGTLGRGPQSHLFDRRRLLLYARDNAMAGNRGKSISGNARTMAERMKNWFQGNF